jgi:hypothetical protein
MLREHQACGIAGRELDAVGMQRQGFAAIEDEVGLLVEGDVAAGEQVHAAGFANASQQRGHGFHIHGIRLMPGQAQQHGLVAAMSLAGGAQRAIQLDTHAGRGGKHARRLQAQHEQAGRAHRTHGVRTGRTDADLEQVEDADGHEVSIGEG